MKDGRARAHRWGSHRLQWVLLVATFAGLAACVAPAERSVRAPAPGQSPADGRTKPSSAEVLFDTAKWDRDGGAHREVVRETTVSIDVKIAERADVLQIRLPDPTPSLLLRTIGGKKRMANGALTWSASVNDSRYETAAFAIVDGVLTASIAAPSGRAYRIRHIKGDMYLLQEIDRSKFPPEACQVPKAIRGELPRPGHDRERMTRVQDTLCSPEDPATSIDVMVTYTDSALAEAGSAATMVGAIENAFDQTNTSYQNSGITHRIARVYPFVEVTYTEESSIASDLDRLLDVNDWQLSGIHTKRKALAADIVVLVTRSSGSCGLAKLMATASTAFAVIPYWCLTDTFSFAHELGHLMGARHDVHLDATRNPPFPFNHGFVQTNPTGGAPHPWFTVMGTSKRCADTQTKGCARIDFWSTPEALFSYYGDVTGNAEEADNRRTLNGTASTVANFMCSSTREPLLSNDDAATRWRASAR